MRLPTFFVRLSTAGLLAGTAMAGDLNPPPGPITPTGRTPINASTTPGDGTALFAITQAGSYYLTGPVSGAAGRHGIHVTASNVRIDLAGFSMTGIGGSADGVFLDGVSNITIIDGQLSGWGGSGIDGAGANGRIENVRVETCGADGISINTGSQVINCTASSCGASGFSSSNEVIFNNCVAGGNVLHGFQAGTNSILKGCISRLNGGAGIANSGINGLNISDCTCELNGSVGIAAPAQSLVSHCIVRGNGAGGITAGDGSTITSCTANENTGVGINITNGCTVTACASALNTLTGYTATSGTTFTSCSARDNTTDGFSIGAGSTARDCTSFSNTGSGIVGTFGCTINNCTTRINTLDGIRVVSDCRVVDNTSDCNGSGAGDGAAIHATSSDNRIDGNNCTDSDRGIDVDVAGNLIIRNTASGNTTNFDIVAGNSVGQIQDVSGIDITSTNPWRNFSF